MMNSTTAPKNQNNPFLGAVRQLFDKLADSIPEGAPKIKAYIAGGVAVHWWVQTRTTDDVDAHFSHRILLTGDTVVYYQDEQGERHALELDKQYNPTFGLEHEDAYDRAVYTGGDLGGRGKIDVYVLSPVDLALSKLSRWAEVDREDVKSLAQAGLLNERDLAILAEEAMLSAVGDPRTIRYNVAEAIEYVQEAARKRFPTPRP